MQLMVKILDDVFEAQPLNKLSNDVQLEQDRCYIPVVFEYQVPMMNDFDDGILTGKTVTVHMTVGVPHYGIAVLWSQGRVSVLLTQYNTSVNNVKINNVDASEYDEFALRKEFLLYLDKCGATIDIKE